MADISLQYLDQPLNTVSVGYKNDDYFGERLFPVTPVKKQSGRYWVFGTPVPRRVRSRPGHCRTRRTSATITR
jgi:hypothetical protein